MALPGVTPPFDPTSQYEPFEDPKGMAKEAPATAGVAW